MSRTERAHAALFDELERQGIVAVDVGRLTGAVLVALDLIRAQEVRSQPYVRCANGACE